MSDYDVIIDYVTKTCFNFFKSHSESYVIGKALKTVLFHDFYFSSYGYFFFCCPPPEFA